MGKVALISSKVTPFYGMQIDFVHDGENKIKVKTLRADCKDENHVTLDMFHDI